MTDPTLPEPALDVRRVVGCMTGTSLDGLDVSLVEIRGRGRGMKVRYLASHSVGLGGLRDELSRMAQGKASAPIEYLRAARGLGALHAQAVRALCEAALAKGVKPDFVVAHGQTVWHAPDESLSWQLFDPWPIVHEVGVPVCYDLRQADLIAGGQGAPITPMADRYLYPCEDESRLVVNLGGVCNVTYLPCDPAGEIRGFDAGPCNILLDGLARRLFDGLAFDRDGQRAARGRVNLNVYESLARHPFFTAKTRRSTGREDFNDAWLDSLCAELRTRMDAHDTLAGAVEAVARVLANTSDDFAVHRVVLAGGGARNRYLVERITRACKHTRVTLSDALGIPCEARESAAFAVLGALSQDGVPITLPGITGADRPGVAGCWAGMSMGIDDG